jgi:hypothetical protein
MEHATCVEQAVQPAQPASAVLVVVAMLPALNPLGVMLAALFFAAVAKFHTSVIARAQSGRGDPARIRLDCFASFARSQWRVTHGSPSCYRKYQIRCTGAVTHFGTWSPVGRNVHDA